MDTVTLNGKHLIEAAPIESSTGNIVRIGYFTLYVKNILQN